MLNSRKESYYATRMVPVKSTGCEGVFWLRRYICVSSSSSRSTRISRSKLKFELLAWSKYLAEIVQGKGL